MGDGVTRAVAEFSNPILHVVVDADVGHGEIPDWLDVKAICAAAEAEYERQRPEPKGPRDPWKGMR